MDSAIYSGYQIPPFYDSMIGKLIVHDVDRPSAIRKMMSALGEVIVEGVTTNVDFQFGILEHEEFQWGHTDTGFVEENFDD